MKRAPKTKTKTVTTLMITFMVLLNNTAKPASGQDFVPSGGISEQITGPLNRPENDFSAFVTPVTNDVTVLGWGIQPGDGNFGIFGSHLFGAGLLDSNTIAVQYVQPLGSNLDLYGVLQYDDNILGSDFSLTVGVSGNLFNNKKSGF